MNKFKIILKNLVILASVFLVANLLVTEFFGADFEDGGFFYSAAITVLAVYLYKKHAE